MGRLSSLQLMVILIYCARGGILPSTSRSAEDTNNKEPPDNTNRTDSFRSGWSSLDVPNREKSQTGVSESEESQDLVVSPDLNRSPKEKLDSTHHLSHEESLTIPPPPVESGSTMSSNSTDPESDITESEVQRMFRLEMFKRKFLDQLGLNEPPNITDSKLEVPPVVLNQLLKEGQRNFDQPSRHRTTSPKQVVVFADQDEADCGPDIAQESCFKFEIFSQMENFVVSSCHMWVYVTHTTEGASVFVGRPQSIYDTKRRVLASKKLYSREGWVELEIPPDAHKWSRHHHLLEISTKPLQADGNRTIARDSEHRPLLVLAMKPADTPALRFPRSAGQCSTGQNTCCRKNFVINFTEIGWGDWIVRPLFFDAHYCAGDCSVTSRHFLRDFAEIMALHIQHGPAASDMSICCVADEIIGKPVVFRNTDGSLESRYMDLVVQSCGCL